MAKLFAYVVMASLCCSAPALAQDVPGLTVTPSSATVLLGDSRRFRAVNRYGRPASFVRWDTSSSDAQDFGDGSDIEVEFQEVGDYTVHAYSHEGSGSATVHVVNYRALPYGATKWIVDSFAGCRTKQLTPAIPAPGSTNAVFMLDQCTQGNVVRALTSDGLENWRTWISEKEVDRQHLDSYEPKALLVKSVCDSIKTEMSRDEVSKLAMAAKVELPESERVKDAWTFEEGKSECRVTFRDGKVTKKRSSETSFPSTYGPSISCEYSRYNQEIFTRRNSLL